MGYEKLALFLLYSFLCRLAFSSSLPHLCPKDQALALLQFKQMFTINPDASDSFYCHTSYPKILSWNRSRDCCSWGGVHCDETTGQVIELDLSCSQLQGKFHSNSSLFKISNLKRLNLSYNDFSGSHISPKFGAFSSLTHLDLSYSSFSGQIPSEISHLSKLYVLRIQGYPNELTLGSHNFVLLVKNLIQLRVLELYRVNISSSFPLNFSYYLTTLRLPFTQLYGTLPERVFHLPNLKSLYLSGNTQLTVRFPMSKWNSSTSLTYLSLSGVKVTGNIPESFSYLTSLDRLYMDSCNLSGPILKPLWNLTRIEVLYLSNNQLEGPISQFFKFGNLKSLWLRNNSFSGILECLNRTQLRDLDISSNSLTGPIPSSVFSLSSLFYLNLRNNHFNGKIEEFKSKTLWAVDLTQNQLQGPIPESLLNQQDLQYLYLPQNNLSGHIASTICNLKTVLVLNLGSNNLQGTIPECLGEMDRIQVLDLSNNNLSGTIQANSSTGNFLSVIKFHGNKLEGKVPGSLINCKYLELLDLDNNELNDTFPKWLGILPNLRILNLRSNKLHESISASRNRNLFAQLQILDLSSNAFSGNLPTGLFENFQTMKINDENMSTPMYVGYEYYSVTITTKGLNLVYVQVLTTNIVIDLSKNGFEGQIPSSIGDLIGLRTLNLSHNVLEGLIPASLQYLSVLESLDLSFNKIGGGIPQQLASLTSLEVLNLSHNHLVGCIPKGNQFDTFENSSYQGMDGLHGFPLSRGCADDGVTQATTPDVLDQGEDEDSFMISWQAVLMGYGCGLIIGLSIIYIISTQNPLWFSRMVVELEHRIVTRIKKYKKRH